MGKSKLRRTAGKIYYCSAAEKLRRKRTLISPRKQNNGSYLIQDSYMYIDDIDTLDLIKMGWYEKDVTNYVKKYIKKSHTVLDLGANIGYYTLMMAKLAKHVHSFEPVPKNSSILEKNIKLNNLNNVTLHKKAVADKNGTVKMHLCTYNNGMHRTYPSKYCDGGGAITVESVKLDDLFDHVDFIKMDTECSEFAILKGMKKLLKKSPTFLLEFFAPGMIEFGHMPLELWDFIESFGYDIRLIDGSYHSCEDIVKINEKTGTNVMIVCTPK